MRRSHGVGLMCLAACLILAQSAMAQGERRGRGRGFGRGGFGFFGSSMLLRNEKVQEELKLTSEQKEKLAALREEGGGRGRAGRGDFQNLSDEEREKAFAEFRKRMDESNKKAEGVLDAGQQKRLKELSLQVRGNSAINDDEVAATLKLTDDQKEAIKTIREESDKRREEMFQGGREGDREERRKKMEELRNDTDAEYLAVLTDEQKARFTEMKGAKADIDFGAIGRGGGGNRRRGNNN